VQHWHSCCPIGPSPNGMARFIAIRRLNALLVTARHPDYLDRVSSWVAHLDRGSMSAQNQQLFVYRV
jgi:hypothetical protein